METSVLVVGQLGSAASTLFAAHKIHVRWALTIDEARAAIALRTPQAILVDAALESEVRNAAGASRVFTGAELDALAAHLGSPEVKPKKGTIPVAMTSDLPLRLRAQESSFDAYRELLAARIKEPDSNVKIPTWLDQVRRELTATERATVLGEREDALMKESIAVRIALERARIDPAELNRIDDAEVNAFLVKLRGDALADLTEIRGALAQKLHHIRATKAS